MRVFIDKPKNSIQGGAGSFQDSDITYNEAGYTYNQAGVVYGGFYGESNKGEITMRVEDTRPTNRTVEEIKPK